MALLMRFLFYFSGFLFFSEKDFGVAENVFSPECRQGTN